MGGSQFVAWAGIIVCSTISCALFISSVRLKRLRWPERILLTLLVGWFPLIPLLILETLAEMGGGEGDVPRGRNDPKRVQ
jgi:hypothetical protein